MLDNLKIALRKQGKLLVIFILTIFVPALTLSVFGLRAIRNERYRRAQQIENNHERTADLLKTQIKSKFDAIESSLQNLAVLPVFQLKDFTEMEDLISSRLDEEPLIGQIILLYKDEDALFPLFQPISFMKEKVPADLSPNQRAVLSDAENSEYRQKNYSRAVSLYEKLAESVGSESLKAEMLANAARCTMSLGSYGSAIRIYSRIADEFPSAVSSSGLPLGLAAELQILECYRKLNDKQKLLEFSLKLYEDFLIRPWNLSQDQYSLYSSMVESSLADNLAQSPSEFQSEPYEKEWTELREWHREYRATWDRVGVLEREIVPELRKKLASEVDASDPASLSLLRLYQGDHLLLGAWIPGDSGRAQQGILAAEIDQDSCREKILEPAVAELLNGEDGNIVISSLQGKSLLGKFDPDRYEPTVTVFFEDNFPPWKLEFFSAGSETGGLKALIGSFYFWTILTLIVILAFGAVLISGTLSKELEIIKIKSDFVSSVSHELKTPLTSIGALIERLKEGKVEQPEKRSEYYSIIAHDTEKLTRLVKNILDFSRIEEGKKEYEFSETDVPRLVKKQIEAVRRDEVLREVNISLRIAENIPPIQADGDALARAVNNLLTNAVKFSPEIPEISVDIGCEDNAVKISVTDRGIGISRDEISKIFEKFYQGVNAQDLTVKGTGLGLTLVRHIVEAHGGRINVESHLGRGSTFSLLLPIDRKVRHN